MTEALDALGRTAVGMALVRAGESRRPDRLFDDPYASAFAAAMPGAFAALAGEHGRGGGPGGGVGAAFAVHGAVRTRFFDDLLLAAARDGCGQVVLLAAGLDARAFRLDWPAGTRLFEIDLPDVLDMKGPVLGARGAVARCERTVVRADLRGDWPARLRAAGFDPAARTSWLAEGLLIYLSRAEAERLLADVGTLSAAGSRLAFEHGAVAGGALARAAALPAMAPYASLWKGGVGADADRRLAAHGWTPRFHPLAVVAEGYGRPLPDAATGGFLTAIREPV